MSKRKTSALRKQEQDTRFSHTNKKSEQTFYTKESKTIDFSQAQKGIRVNKRPVQLIPKSLNQEKYILALTDENTDIIVVGGPAGTGKTYLAMQAAIKALRDGECDRIILSRPAVGVDDEPAVVGRHARARGRAAAAAHRQVTGPVRADGPGVRRAVERGYHHLLRRPVGGRVAEKLAVDGERGRGREAAAGGDRPRRQWP